MSRRLRLYVASSWRNERQPDVVRYLRALPSNPEVYDFRSPHSVDGIDRGTHGRGFHWSEIDVRWKEWTPEQFVVALKDPLCAEGFGSDFAALQWADACLLVMPCGRSAHLEAGFCIGTRKPSAILLSDGEPELMYMMADRLITAMPDLDEWVASVARTVTGRGPSDESART